MKLFKFVGWVFLGLFLFSGLAYGFFPILASKVITQILTDHGFENVKLVIDYPGFQAVTIQSLSFRTSVDSGSTSILIIHMELTYSLDSLFNNVVDTVNIEHVKVAWNERASVSPLFQSASVPGQPTESRIDLARLRSDPIIPSLPFRHLHIKQMEISNPLAPSALRHTSMTANVDSLDEGYEGNIHLEGKDLPLNLITFAFENNGIISLSGIHTNAPENKMLYLKTFLDTSSASLKLKGQTSLNLSPLIQTLGALYPIPSEYQAVTGTLSGTWTETLQDNPPPSGSMLGPIQGTYTVDAHMPDWPSFVDEMQILMQGTFAVNDRGLTLVLHPSSSGTVSLSLNSVIPPLIGPFISHESLRSFSWNIRQPVHLIVPFNKQVPGSIHITTGEIQIDMRNSFEQLEVIFSPNDLHWETPGVIAGKATVTATFNLKPPSTPSLRLETLFFEVEALLTSSADRMAVTLNPTSFFRLSKMDNASLQVPSLQGRFPQGLTWAYHTGQHTWRLQAPASIVVIPSLSFQGRKWDLGKILTKDLVITHTPDKWAITGETEATYVHTQSDMAKLPASKWHTRYSADSSSVSVHFRGQSLGHPLQVGGQVRFDLLTGEGLGSMTMESIRFGPQTLVLSQLIQPWPFPTIDITHGTVTASADIAFSKDTRSATRPLNVTRLHGIVDIKELAGFVSPTMMEGLTTRVEILGEDNKFRITPTPVQLRHIHSVIDLTDTSFILSSGTIHQPSMPMMSVTNLSTHLLGGTVTLEKAVYDPARTTHEVILRVRGLDLGDILRLEQQETVQGTGTLDGELPLHISGSDIEVHHGSLYARPPGGTLHITVSEATARSGAKSQPNLDLILKSLQNFQYSQLKVGVDYEKTGILTLAARLEGKNPEYRKGVPIHFNLNIEENIPALLKSLSLVQGLEDHIKKMMTGTENPPSQEKK